MNKRLLGLAVAGSMVLGLAGALAATRLLQRLLFGVEPADPLTFAVTSLFFLGVVVLSASYLLPGRPLSDPVPGLRIPRREHQS